MSYLPETVNHLDRVLSLRAAAAFPLAVTPQSRGGLVLVNQHYSDFIGPGSRLVWPRHFHCLGIYAVGAVEVCTLKSALARQKSMHIRITGLSILGRILQNFDPMARASLLVNWLCQNLGLGVVKQANLDLLGSLGRVPPEQMETAIRQYEHHLQHLGQTERLSDKYYLVWLRHQLALPDSSLGLAVAPMLEPDVDFDTVIKFAPDRTMQPAPQPAPQQLVYG